MTLVKSEMNVCMHMPTYIDTHQNTHTHRLLISEISCCHLLGKTSLVFQTELTGSSSSSSFSTQASIGISKTLYNNFVHGP